MRGKPKSIKKKLEKFQRDIRAEIEKHHFKHHNVDIGSSNKEDDQLVTQDEQLRENVAAWLPDEKVIITMGQVKEAFGVATSNVDPVAKSSIERLMKKMTSAELVPCCKKIDDCIGEIGSAETGIFLYQLIHKLGLQDFAITTPKLRVMFAMLIGAIHQSIGPQISSLILVHFMADLDRTLENIKKSPNDSSSKLDNMISFACYLIAAKSCSLKFLEVILAKIGNCTEDAIKKNLKRVLQMASNVFDKPGQHKIEKILAPYRAALDDDSDD